jgi:membrane-associated phospholipid phosphatase
MAKAPLQWKSREWRRFGEGVGTVAVVMLADKKIDQIVQRNRSSFTNSFSRHVTPFGGGRAMQISALLLGAGLVTHNDRLFDAGRDSLEAEVFAAGIVTPVLKDAFGRARPNTGEGAWKFYGFRADNPHNSFPSGHSTNAWAAATAIAAHYDGVLVPSIAYTIATGVSFARVNDHVHFASDVVAGALIGHAVARGLIAHHHANVRVTPVITPGGAGLIFSYRR